MIPEMDHKMINLGQMFPERAHDAKQNPYRLPIIVLLLSLVRPQTHFSNLLPSRIIHADCMAGEYMLDWGSQTIKRFSHGVR
jgi:hypothetical protein